MLRESVFFGLNLVAGSPETVARQLQEIGEVEGTAGVMLTFDEPMPGLERFCADVLPRLEGAPAPPEPEDQMSLEENKALFRRWFEDVVNANDYAAVEELLAPGYWPTSRVRRSPSTATATRGWWSCSPPPFPDWQESIQDVIAEGDRVVLRVTAGGTHEGEFQGIAPTGETVTITGIGIARIEDGRIAESWWEFDAIGLMQQLGAISAPAA